MRHWPCVKPAVGMPALAPPRRGRLGRRVFRCRLRPRAAVDVAETGARGSAPHPAHVRGEEDAEIVLTGSVDPQLVDASPCVPGAPPSTAISPPRRQALASDLVPPLSAATERKRLETVVDSQGALSLQPARPPNAADLSREPSGSSSAEGRFSGSLKGMLFLNLGAALFGSNQVVIKVAEKHMSPGALSAVRFWIAAVCFSPAIVQGLQKPRLRNAAFELGCWLFGGYTAQALGLMSTTAARGAFTGTFTVLVVPILVGLSGRKISMSTWVAAAVALLGVGCLTTTGADPNIGDLWCIISAILFGVHKWRSEEVTSQFEETNELVAVQILFLALASLVYCVPELYQLLQSHSVGDLLSQAKALPWGSLAYMGLGTTALTLWLEMSSLKEVSSPLAALIYTAEPVWGSLFAYLCLDERWGAAGWVGAALIISSSLFSQLGGDADKDSNSPQGQAADKKAT